MVAFHFHLCLFPWCHACVVPAGRTQALHFCMCAVNREAETMEGHPSVRGEWSAGMLNLCVAALCNRGALCVCVVCVLCVLCVCVVCVLCVLCVCVCVCAVCVCSPLAPGSRTWPRPWPQRLTQHFSASPPLTSCPSGRAKARSACWVWGGIWLGVPCRCFCVVQWCRCGCFGCAQRL